MRRIVILLALLSLVFGFKFNSQRKFGSRNLGCYAFLSDDSLFPSGSVLKLWPGRSVPVSEPSSQLDIPSSGIIEYKGDTSKVNGDGPRWATDELTFVPPSRAEQFWTRFNLWKQWPWKKIRGKVVLKAKIGGALPLEPTPKGFAFGAVPDLEPVGSLQEVINMLNYGSYDPRVKAVLLEIDRLDAGYAKLTELKRFISLFRASGKKVYAYCSGGAEKELFVGLGCDELYVPPDGGLDLRGFSAAATFVRGVFDKIGIEPQVQRIGKYKSFGDTFNRTDIAEAQREVVSSLLMEASDFWVAKVSEALDVPVDAVMQQLWRDSGIKSPADYREMGLISGVKYLDQVEVLVRDAHAVRSNEKSNGSGSGSSDSEAGTDNSLLSMPMQSFGGRRMAGKMKAVLNETMPGVIDFTNDTTIYTSAMGAIQGEIRDYTADFSLSRDFVSNTRRSLANFTQSTADAESAVAQAKVDISTNSTLAKEIAATRMEAAKARKAKVRAAGARKFFESKTVRSWPSLLPAGLYLRKMRKGSNILKGLRLREARAGERVAVINAIGGINQGRSGNGPMGRQVGSDSIIKLIRLARKDPNIKALVLRIDSPGGSALASDLMWRELRALASEKPVIASQVDVAASGGYYLSMACDAIFAEELTVTGSIGVVTAKFNLAGLNEKLGFGSETISRGRYAEVLSSNRGFTQDEESYFEEGAQQAYSSFITKAAASRGMSVEAMHEVAQGRVWTGRQALSIGLVDRMGGLWAAARAAAFLADMDTASTQGLTLQVLTEPRGGLPIPGLGGSTSAVSATADYFVDDVVADCSLVSADSMGIPPALRSMGVGAMATHLLKKGGAGLGSIIGGISICSSSGGGGIPPLSVKGLLMALEDRVDNVNG